jgi:predicted kinase
LPALRLNSDEWMVQLYGPDPPEEVFRPGVERVNTLIHHLAERALQLNLDVVLDEGFWTRNSRDDLRSWAAELGVSLRFYSVNLPKSEAWQRVQKRNAEPGSLHIAPETFELFFSRFEPLGPDELHEAGTQTG